MTVPEIEVEIEMERHTIETCTRCGGLHPLSGLNTCGDCGARYCERCGCECPTVEG